MKPTPAVKIVECRVIIVRGAAARFRSELPMTRRARIASVVLLLTVVGSGVALAAWKHSSIKETEAAAANQPEPMESVIVAVAQAREHSHTTTSIGTVIALRSITLRNELAGTVRQVALNPGQIVDAGTVLVGLDVSVEQAELKAQRAQANLAQTLLARVQNLSQQKAISEEELDRARAEHDVAQAQVERTQAVIARKTIRAPFRARVGIADVHPGQYLNEGTELTTLQGVDEAAHVDFAVAQQVAATLRKGGNVAVFVARDAAPIKAAIEAIDARVDPTTRNAMVRARIDHAAAAPSPGASVRVQVPVGAPRMAVAVPISALRKGPSGDHVFVIAADKDGKARAQLRPVHVGATLGDEVVIEEGLTAGEQVAASGSFKLRDAVLVAVASDTQPSPRGGR
jgi:membrane fusion protein, multidrug efflux system